MTTHELSLPAPMAPAPARLAYRIAEVVRVTGLSRSKVYELIADKTLPVTKVGSVTLIPAAALHALVNPPEQAAAA